MGICFIFANCHRYLANHSAVAVADCSDEDADVDDKYAPPVEDITGGIDQLLIDFHTISLDHPESAATQAEEARELLLLELAKHIQMERAQQCLYQACVAAAVHDAREDHSVRTYMFVVDYGQNMEIQTFNNEQPVPAYYYSPVGVYNLGVVNHAHVYNNSSIGKRMYAYIYNERVGKKGANNVASLILKTLQQLNLLQDDAAGGELYIIFDNCLGQNKNNTVLKLAGWLQAMGYFKKVEFIFLIVGHTKNAADSLFNSLKHKYLS